MTSKATIRKRTNKFKNKDIRTASSKTGGAAPFLLMIPALIFMLLFMFIPLVSLTANSFNDWGTEYNPFFKVINDDSWWASVGFSLSYSLLTLVASLSLSLIASSIIAGMIRRRARGFWQTLFFIPYVTSIVAISVVFSIIFDQDHGLFARLFGITMPWLYTPMSEGILTLLTIWIFGIWQSMAFQILILVTAMLAMDKRLYDAADVDGISKRRQFTKITLPQLRKVINYLIIIGLITSVKSFTMALYQNDKDVAIKYAPTMLLYIYRYTDNASFRDMAGAASVLMIVICIAYQFVITSALTLFEKIGRKLSKIRKDRKLREIEKNITFNELTTEIKLRGLK